MTRTEFLAWAEFYRREPFDDYARFYRPAALLANQAGPTPLAMSLDDLFAFLVRKPQEEEEAPPPATSRYSEADLAVFKAFGRKPPGT